MSSYLPETDVNNEGAKERYMRNQAATEGTLNTGLIPCRMRDVIILLLLFFLGLPASKGQDPLLSKRISVDFNRAAPGEVFNKLSETSGVHFSYNSDLVDPEASITLSGDNITLQEALDKICRQLDLGYKVVRDQIILHKAIRRAAELPRHTVSGTVRDGNKGETLPGATVLVEGENTGTITNSYGFYSLTLPEGRYTILYSFIGYAGHKAVVELDGDTTLSPGLMPDISLLQEVVVTTDQLAEQIAKSQMSRINVHPASLASLPEFAGEVGLIKSLQTLPGIKTHSDGSAFFFVRGGNKDQNLILIDEAPVYNPAHLFGYYSVIIPDVAKKITIYKGDMPVDKGDRLSSVIEVQTKDGNMKQAEINGMLNPLIYRFSLEGPVVKDKCSFFTSFRHSNFKWLYRREVPNLDLYLYDVNAKINWQVNKNNRLYFNFFYGEDNITNTESGDNGGIRWYNFTSTLRWTHIFNKKLFSNATVYAGNYDYSLSTQGTEWASAIQNFSLGYDLTWYPHPGLTLMFGLSQTAQAFNPGNLTQSEENQFLPKIEKSRAGKTALYFSAENSVGERFSWKAGLRLPVWINRGATTVYLFDTSYTVSDTLVFGEDEVVESYARLDPRISVKYRLSANTSLKASYGIYHQFIHLISNSISPFTSFESWLPSGRNIRPQRAGQVAAGIVSFIEKPGIELNLEGYYKEMENQIDYEPHASLMLNPLIEGELRFGTARSYGIELLLRKAEGRISGWIGYTWSRVLKKIGGLNEGREFPAFYDRPHDLSIFAAWKISPRVTFSAGWVYYTGSAITTPVAYYSFNDYTVPLYGDKNNDRLPDYHRLDVALAWKLNKKPGRYAHSLTFGIYNLYNRHNPISVNFNKIATEEGNYVVPANLFGTGELLSTQKYLLGLVPSITYRFRVL